MDDAFKFIVPPWSKCVTSKTDRGEFAREKGLPALPKGLSEKEKNPYRTVIQKGFELAQAMTQLRRDANKMFNFSEYQKIDTDSEFNRYKAAIDSLNLVPAQTALQNFAAALTSLS